MSRFCSEPGCQRRVHAKGKCQSHYQKARWASGEAPRRPKKYDPETTAAFAEDVAKKARDKAFRQARIDARIRKDAPPAEVLHEMYGLHPKDAQARASELGVTLAKPNDWFGLVPA